MRCLLFFYSDASLELHLEIILTCFVLLSCHIYGEIDVSVEDGSSKTSKKRSFLTAIRQNSNELSKYLIGNVVNRFETPKAIVQNSLSGGDDKSSSVVVASFDCELDLLYYLLFCEMIYNILLIKG